MYVPNQPQRDYLTGFYLRDAFYTSLERLIIDATSKKKTFLLVLIDLDGFKKFNDKFGHLFGDEVLKHVASIVRLFFPENLCFRFGGDEFVALLADKDPKEAFNLLLKLKNHMAQFPFLSEGKSYQTFKISFSCGIAEFPSDGQKMEELIKKADEAMYFSKHYGHNFINFANKMKYIKSRSRLIYAISFFVILHPGKIIDDF